METNALPRQALDTDTEKSPTTHTKKRTHQKLVVGGAFCVPQGLHARGLSVPGTVRRTFILAGHDNDGAFILLLLLFFLFFLFLFFFFLSCFVAYCVSTLRTNCLRVRVRAVGAGGIKRSNPFVYGGAGWEHAEY
jgi:hypothetical protein